MKKLILFAVIMGTGTLIVGSAPNSQAAQLQKTRAAMATTSLNLLKQYPNGAVAVYDFQSSCLSQSYKISSPMSQKILKNYGLLNPNGQAHQASCEALKAVGYFKNMGQGAVGVQKK